MSLKSGNIPCRLRNVPVLVGYTIAVPGRVGSAGLKKGSRNGAKGRAVRLLSIENLNPDSLIAYVKVYRRIPVGQDTCGCNLYEYADSLSITKAVYLDTAKADCSSPDLVDR